MIHFVYGPSGYGKTHLISEYIKNDVANGTVSYLIVPEQEALARERDALSFLPPSAQLNFEVLNFSRLSNKLFRIYGGLSYNYITRGMSAILMWRTLKELSPLLSEYGGSGAKESGLTENMLSTVREFKMHGVSAAKLEMTAYKLSENSALRKKLSDLALIYASYEGLVSESYSDSLDDISKANELLSKHDYFNGANIYIDSFTSFTHSELEMIKTLFSQAANVTITLCCDSPNSQKMHFKSVCDTAKKLKDIADGKKISETFLTENHRTDSHVLRALEENIWSFDASNISVAQADISDDCKDLTLISCKNSYSEAEAISNIILELVQNGYRYKDIAVITRDASSYIGITDAAFEKAEIPYFLSEKTDLTSKPLIKLILSAFRIKFSNWKTTDVISHVKTGLYNLPQKDLDMFEEYVSAWKISGNRFISGDWNMNPDGYSDTITERGKNILSAANRVRDAVTIPLFEFFTQINAAENAADMCRAVYLLLDGLDVKSTLEALAEKYLASGERRLAEETVRLYNVTLKVLSDMVAAIGEESMSADEFASLLKIAFDNADIGSIPTSKDAVTVASASMFRADKVKVAVLFGLNDGEFPASISEGGLLSSNEKSTLAELGVDLSSDPLTQNTEELLYVYRAMSCPSDKLIISHQLYAIDDRSMRESSAFSRVKALFPKAPHVRYDRLEHFEKTWSKAISFEHMPELSNTEEHVALCQVLSEHEEYKSKLSMLSIPVSDKHEIVDKDTMDSVLGDRLKLSPSSIEAYVKCHFSYYCSRLLRLRDTKSISFGANNSGTFLHSILKHFMEKAVVNKKLNLSLSESEIYAIIDEAIDEFILSVCPDVKETSMRLYATFMRLRRLSYIVIKSIIHEFEKSDFVPSFFEANIGDKPDSLIPTSVIELDDGTEIKLNGTIDRVDLYKASDNEVYIRIVDYKSSEQNFSISNVRKGLNLQMLLYLFALTKSDSVKIKNAICAENATLLPAGVTYQISKLSSIQTETPLDEKRIEEIAEESLKRESYLLADIGVLKALSHDLDPKYVTKSLNIEGESASGPTVATLDELYSLEAEINGIVADVAEKIKNGDACSVPIDTDKSPCEYCSMSPICRNQLPKQNKFY